MGYKLDEWVKVLGALVLGVGLVLAVGCTRIAIDGVGSYTRMGTDFNGELVKTSETLTLKIGSHLNPSFVTLPATALGTAVGAAK